MIPRAQGEWIHSISPMFELKAREDLWLPITVEPETGTIGGLPDVWRDLSEILLQEARKHAGTLTADAKKAAWHQQATRRASFDDRQPPPVKWPVKLVPEDLLYGVSAHEQYLEEALSSAHSTVFLVSAFVSFARLEAIRELLRGALRRGVMVDLVWGYEAEEKAVNWLHNLAKEAKSEQSKGELRFNRKRSESHAKLILWNRSAERFEACVGSCNWLSMPPKVSGNAMIDISVRLTRPGLLAQSEPISVESVQGSPIRYGWRMGSSAKGGV